MAIPEEVSKYFQDVAGSWDEIRAGYFDEGVREAAIVKAYLRSEMTVADIGAGTGFIAAGLAPLVSKVHVVDGSEAMLEVARRNLATFDNVEYHQADGLALPFPEGSLDAIFANMYLHLCADPLAAIREMVRVLRPGGRVMITDMDAHPHAWLKEELKDVWQGFERGQMRAWFSEAGLVNAIVGSSGESCCAESTDRSITDEQGRKATISIFFATGTRRMVMREAVQGAYAARAEAGSCSCSSPSQTSAGQAGGSSCCSGTPYEDISFPSGYSAEEMTAAPQEAAEFSLGCGNPIALANLKPGEVVLDIGSGGGLDSFLAAKKVGPSGQVIGVDMTPAMLERARASAARSGINNVEFRKGYAEELPVEDGSVDVILSNCVINLTEDKGQVFREAYRALRPGGRLEVSDVVTSGPVPLEMRGNTEGWSECVTGALPEPEYLDLIAQAGFEGTQTRRSPSIGEAFAVSAYSVIVSARKPGGRVEKLVRPTRASSCGCGPGCCGN